MVRLVTQVMWYPRATSPYMLPSASPLTRSWTSTRAALLRRDGDDLAALPDHHDVVFVGERVVLLRAEGPLVRLDEAAVLRLEILQRLAQLRPVDAARLLDGQRHQMHPVVGIGGAHRRDHVLRSLDAVLLRERLEHRLPALALLAEEGVGLQEHHPVGELAGELGEAAARDAPVGDHGDLPADLGARLHH